MVGFVEWCFGVSDIIVPASFAAVMAGVPL